MRGENIGRRRKGETEWGKLSHIKEARKSFYNGGEEGGGKRERVNLTLTGFDLRRE